VLRDSRGVAVALLTLAPLTTSLAMRALPVALVGNRAVTFGVDCAVSFGVIWAAVPMCIAIWPQMQQASPADLEPQFRHDRHPATGGTLDKVWFNRGL